MFDSIFSSDTLINLVKTGGYLGIFAVVFAETGLFVGFFLPGDSLLFTAGFLASLGFLNVWFLAIGVFIAAVVGDSVGYSFGLKTGPKIFKKQDSLFFHKAHLIRAENFCKKYGSFTIVAARFVPIVRTFAPIVAGVGKMEYKNFLLFNIIGGFLWSFSITFAGYLLPRFFPGVEKNLTLIIFLIIFISFLPTLFQFLKEIKKGRGSNS
ncbi:MAG: VTT domain-containing protein [Candidatus Paceibacterota bacterium]